MDFAITRPLTGTLQPDALWARESEASIQMSSNPFTHHPHEVGESYGQHFGHAMWFGVRMIGGGLACMVHAVFPFLCVRTGSQTMDRLHAKLHGRSEKANWERHPII